MIEKILCKTCYHSVLRKATTYCKYYDKYMNRRECSKFDHDEYKFYTRSNKNRSGNKKVNSKANAIKRKPTINRLNSLEIREKKLKIKAQKRAKIKPEQENICRFATIRYEVIERIDGKYQHIGNQNVDGLQIKNKVYLNNGHYKMINSKSVNIINIYTSIPEWANEHLLSLYDSQVK